MHIVEVVNNMADMGHDVHIAGFLRSRPRQLHRSVVFHNVSLRNRGCREFAAPSFWRSLARNGIEMLKGDGHPFYVSHLALILDSKSFDLVYERDSDAEFAILLASERGIPSILELEGIWPLEMEWKGYAADEVRRALKQRLQTIDLAAKVVSVSPGARDYYVENGADASKFDVIPNGANADLFRPLDRPWCREKLGWGPEEKIIVFAGSLQIFYEVDCLIRAMPSILKRVPKARLVVVGRDYKPPFGLGRENLRSLSGDLGVAPFVSLLDVVPYWQVPIYIGASNVCMLPIAQKDGWRAAISPLKLREYLACSRPVVASDVPGDAQIVNEIGSGSLYQPGDFQDLADSVSSILENPVLSSQMGENGRRFALEHGTWRRVAERIMAIAEETVRSF